MNRTEKEYIVEKLSEKFGLNSHFYITNASGLTVEAINAFRRLCFKAGIEYGVYKNTLIRKAMERSNIDNKELFDVLRGETGIIFSKELGNAPAKVIQKYRKSPEDKPFLKAASVDSDLYFGNESVKVLSAIKSKNEIIGDVISLLQSPAKNVLSSLLSGKQILSSLVKTLNEREK